jgi:hypothetical protein
VGGVRSIGFLPLGWPGFGVWSAALLVQVGGDFLIFSSDSFIKGRYTIFVLNVDFCTCSNENLGAFKIAPVC